MDGRHSSAAHPAISPAPRTQLTASRKPRIAAGSNGAMEGEGSSVFCLSAQPPDLIYVSSRPAATHSCARNACAPAADVCRFST